MPQVDPTFDPCADPFPRGWICPGCKTIHAPFVESCTCQQPKARISSHGSEKFRWLITNPFFTMAFEDFDPQYT